MASWISFVMVVMSIFLVWQLHNNVVKEKDKQSPWLVLFATYTTFVEVYAVLIGERRPIAQHLACMGVIWPFMWALVIGWHAVVLLYAGQGSLYDDTLRAWHLVVVGMFITLWWHRDRRL